MWASSTAYFDFMNDFFGILFNNQNNKNDLLSEI